MIGNFLDFIAGAVFDLLGAIVGILPTMPLSADSLNEYMQDNIVVTALQWVNYFLPVSVLLGIFGAWSAAMLAYAGIKIAIKYGKDVL